MGTPLDLASSIVLKILIGVNYNAHVIVRFSRSRYYASVVTAILGIQPLSKRHVFLRLEKGEASIWRIKVQAYSPPLPSPAIHFDRR